MTTEAERVLGDGVQITLTDGRAVTLKYNLRAIAKIEAAFGSLDGMSQALGEGKPVITSTVKVIAAGAQGVTEDELFDLLDPSKLNEYADAMSKALEQAFPPQKGGEGPARPSSPLSGVPSTGLQADSAELTTSSV